MPCPHGKAWDDCWSCPPGARPQQIPREPLEELGDLDPKKIPIAIEQALERTVGLLVGQVMRQLLGRANPVEIEKAIRIRLQLGKADD